MKKAKITKIGVVGQPIDPNLSERPEGRVDYGTFIEEPQIGKRFNLYPISYIHGERGISTSGVLNIIDEKTFETHNSVYRWELID